MTGRTRTYDPKKTVKNFIYLYLESFDEIEYSEPMVSGSETNLSGENELNLRLEGCFSTKDLDKINQMLHICEEAVSNI